MTKTALPTTLIEAVRYFASADNCRDYLVARRWPDGVTCPQCGSASVYFDKGRNGWECKTRHPKRKFSLKTGTIFEDSPLGLDKWLPCVWLIANAKNGVSSHEIARALGVTQKTAWFMLQRIRLALQGDNGGKLGGDGGTVEVDESYIGGKTRHQTKWAQKHGHDAKGRPQGRKGPYNGKTIVMGLLERESPEGHSIVRTMVVESPRRVVLAPLVREHVAVGSNLMTDSLKSYRELADTFIHKFVDHAETYVDGQVHTNGIENFWALLKRALKGTYVAVEPFHLFRYLDEQVFRFNNRKATDAMRFALAVKGIIGKRLTYTELIAADAGTV